MIMKNIIVKILLLVLGLFLSVTNGSAQNTNSTTHCLEIKWIADYQFYSLYGNGVHNRVTQILNKVEDIFKTENCIDLNIIDQGYVHIYNSAATDPFSNPATLPCHGNNCSTIAKVWSKLVAETPTIQSDEVLLFSGQLLSNHGVTLGNSMCSHHARVVGLAVDRRPGSANLGQQLSVTQQARIMAHELVHTLTDGKHEEDHSENISGLMNTNTPFGTSSIISPTLKSQMVTNLSNQGGCFGCTSLQTRPFPSSCSTPPSNPCYDHLEPNNDFNNGSSISPNGSLRTISDLCLKQPDIDIFEFKYNNTDFYIAVGLKSSDTGERHYNLTYKLSSQGELEVETIFASGASPPDTELYLIVELGGIYYRSGYDDNSGSNPPLSKLTVNINNPVIVNPESLVFTCGSGCSDNLLLNCGALSASFAGDLVTISNAQVSNQSNTTVYDIELKYSLVSESGAETELNTVTGNPIIIDEIPANTVSSKGGLVYIPSEINGVYNLRARLVGYGNSCTSTETLYLGYVPPPPFVSCFDGIQNQGEAGIDCDGPCPPCPSSCQNTANRNGSITGSTEVEKHILSPSQGNKATVNSPNSATFNAGRYISLNPGFTAQYGSVFNALIDGCDNGNKVETEQAPVTLRNYPNPFTGQTNIEFVLPQDSPVTLFVSDMTGRKVAILLNNETQTEGTHLLTFDGSNYPAGMYYYTIQAGEYLGTQKMILVK